RVIIQAAEHDLLQSERGHRKEQNERRRGAEQKNGEDRRSQKEQRERNNGKRPDHGRALPADSLSARSARISRSRRSALTTAVPEKPSASALCGTTMEMPSAMLVCPMAPTRATKAKDCSAA